MHKFLLVLLALALALSPLRATFAMQQFDNDDTDAHCAQLQNDMHLMGHAADMQDKAAVNPEQGCDQGCGGDCCDGACNACVHGTAALSSPVTVSLESNTDTLNNSISCGVTARTLHPPFRPPISLHS